jgi:hypothetical protein
MSEVQQERINKNVQRSAGIQALKEIRGIVEQDMREEAARAKLLRGMLRYGLAVLILVAGLLALFYGVF